MLRRLMVFVFLSFLFYTSFGFSSEDHEEGEKQKENVQLLASVQPSKENSSTLSSSILPVAPSSLLILPHELIAAIYMDSPTQLMGLFVSCKTILSLITKALNKEKFQALYSHFSWVWTSRQQRIAMGMPTPIISERQPLNTTKKSIQLADFLPISSDLLVARLIMRASEIVNSNEYEDKIEMLNNLHQVANDLKIFHSLSVEEEEDSKLTRISNLIIELVTWERIVEQVGDQVWWKVWAQIADEVRQGAPDLWPQVFSQVRMKAKFQCGFQVLDKVLVQARNQIDESIRDQVKNQLESQVKNQIEYQIMTQVVSELETKVLADLEKFSFKSNFSNGNLGKALGPGLHYVFFVYQLVSIKMRASPEMRKIRDELTSFLKEIISEDEAEKILENIQLPQNANPLIQTQLDLIRQNLPSPKSALGHLASATE